MFVTQNKMNRDTYSAFLKENKVSLINKFVDNVRKKMPSAKGLDNKTIENSLDEFIETVAEVISIEELPGVNLFLENIRVARLHGKLRADIPCYTLDQVITEFRILRCLIFELLEKEYGPLPRIEREKIFFTIDNGVTQAATEFALRKGLSEARLSEEVFAKEEALKKANELQTSIGEMQNQEKMRDNFVSTVSHDMRNPLSVARAGAEMIKRRPESAETIVKYVDKIIENIDRANQMIKDLLDSNRIKSGGKLPIHKEHCNIAKLLKETLEDFLQVYGNRFQLNSPASAYEQLDPGGMRRAIENLIINAIKYGSPESLISITLQQNDEETRISIHNEGNPIPLKEQAGLFNFQHRTALAQQGKQEGWGIGLTLVKGIVEGHDGRVKVRSSRNEGTTFSIIIPAEHSE